MAAVKHDNKYYATCMMGGVIACGTTHTSLVPLDIAKISMQSDPKRYRNLSQSMRTIHAAEGITGLTKGWLPTMIGYSLQGCFKFGLNEVFKDYYASLLGEENAHKYRGIMWTAAAASAEFCADIALCPLEMIKVKVQISEPGTFPTGFMAAASAMMKDKTTRFPFGSLVPLWSRQVPYTMAKFVGFEFVAEQLYSKVFTKPRDQYTSTQQLGVTFLSGYLAGIFCAIVSQPADNLVSQMGKVENAGKGFGQMAREVGISNLFLSGLGTRIVMIGTLTGLQFYIYDQFRVYAGLGTSGGGNTKK
ncbi:Phosphate carrier protein, mitochondrial [Hondaea fermentalgiana]|uniref:Phosphate carrier protein, mitochondrial n=1 Tax=Hondaea fermentalgiana TaxID=2315210 RepID=A0A2R5G2G9_9STRA|nr:Phosphate carrier protein, mitochondrial [Hondaea fermentalgiana]|eukprot:GBG25200.1 Phosphate carrier protein, mitochondrial [Hondaea fermentalgiana]